MGLAFAESYAYMLTMQILTAIAFVSITVLVIIQCVSYYHQVKKHHGERSRLLSKIYSANSFTTICLFSWSIQSLISVVTAFGVGINQLGCYPILCVHFGLYFLAMLSKWYVFVYRLTIIYNSSTYEYSTHKIKLLRLFILLYVLGLLSWTWIDIEVDTVIIKSLHLCTFELNKLILIFLNVSDILLSITIMVLFVRPIYKLAAAQIKSDREESGTESRAKVKTIHRWKRLILKYFTTTFTATFSTTLLAVLVIIVGNGKLICIDNTLNSFCLVLMCKGFDKHFDFVCCGFVAIFKPIFDTITNRLLGTLQLKAYTSNTDLASRNFSSYDPNAKPRTRSDVTSAGSMSNENVGSTTATV